MLSTLPVASKGAAGFVFCGELRQVDWNEIGAGGEVLCRGGCG
jgi:hypothetical protein